MKETLLLSRLLNRWPVKIICVALAIILYILFRVNTITERQITVPLEIITTEGFIVSSDHPGSVIVTLRGDEDEIKGILPDDVQAYVNLSRYTEEGEYQVQVELSKRGTALQPEALELRPRPREIAIALEPRTVRSLVVRPELSGFPALGFQLTQYFVSPSSVTAVGPQSQMAGLTELKTELIDLSGRRDDFTVTSRILRPSPQIEIPGGQTVEFRGVIDEAVIIRTITDRQVVVFDMSEDLRVEGDLPRVSMTVQGNQLIVEEARPQDMIFYIDGSGISGPGTYTLPLTMDIPQGLAVLQLLPREVTISVVRAADQSPEVSP